MTKKDYVKFAESYRKGCEAINAQYHDEIQRAARIADMRKLIDGMCNIFAQDNPRFDRARFLAACGVTD